MPIEVPKNLAELFRNPQKLRDALSLLARLEKLRIVNDDGIAIPIRFSETDAVIDFKTPAPAPPESFEAPLDPETIIWRDGIIADGGSFESDSIAIADALIKEIKTKAYNSKIFYLLPFIGSGIAAAMWPLRNYSVTAQRKATNHSFVNGDFSQATGIQGNGSKWMDCGFTSSEVGASNNGGVGYWEMNLNGGEPWTIGSDNSGSQNYGLGLWSDELFYWGDGISATRTNLSAGNHHYYGQRTSDTDRKLYKNGSVVASNTSSGASVTGIAGHACGVFSKSGGTYISQGRCGVAYWTDGTLTDAEALDFNALLDTHLISATGR